MTRGRLIRILLFTGLGTGALPVHAQTLAPDAIFGFSISMPLDGDLSRREILEMGAVTLTGAGHLAFSAMDASNVFIPVVALGWGGYVYYRARTDPDFLRSAGFRGDNLGPAFRDATLLAAGSMALMAGAGALKGSLVLDRHMVPLLILYPAWGIVQQFLVQGLVTRHLASTSGWTSSPYFVAPVSAAVFASVHLPSLDLTAGTFALGLAYAPLYLKHRNLLPLGLYHGWLGVFYYFWILERDPWKYVAE